VSNSSKGISRSNIATCNRDAVMYGELVSSSDIQSYTMSAICAAITGLKLHLQPGHGL
jgi:hypothetical protein